MKRISLLVVCTAIAASMIFACSTMKARCVNCVVKVTTLRGVQFDFNKAELRDDGKKILSEDIDLLKKDKSLHVSIEGHCDIIGNDDYNQKLSEKRAFSVANYLEQSGIDKSRLKVVGWGRKKPLVPNDTDANRALNRRVEIIIIRGDK